MNRRGFLGSILAGLVGVVANPSITIDWAPRLSSYELLKRLLQNGIEAHDNLLERALFDAS